MAGEGRGIKCINCDKWKKNASDIEEHSLKSHRPFKEHCHFCGNGFLTPAELKIHIKSPCGQTKEGKAMAAALAAAAAAAVAEPATDRH